MSGNRDPAVLVSGGAGYVGSHVAAALMEAGYRAVVLDDFSGGRREAVPPGAELVEADAEDRQVVAALVEGHGIEAALHLAGNPGVDGPPEAAWRDAAMSRAFAEACAQAGVRRLVLASSAAVLGWGSGNYYVASGPRIEGACPGPRSGGQAGRRGTAPPWRNPGGGWRTRCSRARAGGRWG